jgi:AcrR family transcriptional regulator
MASPPSPLSRRDARVAETRHALLGAGRALFGTLGFAATSVDDLARHAGVTTGALYHHFTTKADLFEVVFEQLESELSERSNAVARTARTPLEGLKLGFDAFLDASLEPDVQRIVLVDAPAVLGIGRYHAIDEKYAHAPILAALRAAEKEGTIDATDLDVLARLLLGALMQGGMLIAQAPDQRRTRAAVGKSLRRMLQGLGAR